MTDALIRALAALYALMPSEFPGTRLVGNPVNKLAPTP